MHLFVVGVGYVGLTTASGLSELGHDVVAHDIDASVVATLRGGRSPIHEAGLEDAIRRGSAAGRLRFTSDPVPPPDTDIAVVCVPTPTDAQGLLDPVHVVGVVAALLKALPPDRIIAVRSTLPLHGPSALLEVAPGSHRPAIVVNPEFMREGRALADFKNPSRIVVGGLTPADRDAAATVATLYGPLDAPTIVADAQSVVLLKLISNVFLGAKVAFANEVARLCDSVGADYPTVADGIGLDPRIGRSFLDAGPGFGGSCLPEQAETIAVELERRGVDGALLASIGTSNVAHQRALVRAIEELLGGSIRGARIALLGVAFKANTDDVRRSPGLALAAFLRERGAVVVAYDPIAAANARRADPKLDIVATATDATRGSDAVVVATEWPEFAGIDWAAIAGEMRGDLVYDTRHILSPAAVAGAGLRYASLGRGVGTPSGREAGGGGPARIDGGGKPSPSAEPDSYAGARRK